MKQSFLSKFLVIVALSLGIAQITCGQSKSGIGVAYGINKPFSGDYTTGGSFQIFGNIALSNKWAIVPNVGYDRLNSNHRVVYDATGFAVKRISSIDMVHLGASGKYCFNNQWFAKAGATIYAAGGNEDLAGLGIGGSAAAGYNLNLDEHNNLELSINTDVVDIQSGGNGITPMAGLKVAYVFNFKGGR